MFLLLVLLCYLQAEKARDRVFEESLPTQADWSHGVRITSKNFQHPKWSFLLGRGVMFHHGYVKIALWVWYSFTEKSCPMKLIKY